MGCTISNGGASLAVQRRSEIAPLPPSPNQPEDIIMGQNVEQPSASGTVEKLEADLRRFSVGGTESQAAATVSDDHQGDDSSSSSSSSSDGLPNELHPADGTRAGPLDTQPPTAPLPGDAGVGLLYDQSMEQHFGPDHYERPARIIQLHATLQEQQLMGRCWQLVPRQATDEELKLAHSEEHIRKVDAMFSELYPARADTLADATYCYADGRMGDVYICEGTAKAARFAAGCCVQAVQSVLSGTVSRALAVVRPPGHHAECERAMGFCFFNNVAVAALAALQQPGVRRVAVLDWDVHHGNGIQNLLAQRPDALYVSLHRDPKRFYPYHSGFLNEAGEGPGLGFNVNVPWLKKGMADGDYMAAFSLIVEPILESYQPDLVIVAAGFDAADGDPLGGCKVSPEGYAWMTERLMRFAGGRLVLALEGGYNTRVTSWCAAACVRAMLEGRASPPLPADKEHLWPSEAHNSLKLVYEFQRQYWPVLGARSWTEGWEGHLKDVNRLLGVNVRAKRGSSGGGAAASGASENGAVRSSSGEASTSSASTAVPPPGRALSLGGRPSAGGAARRSGGGEGSRRSGGGVAPASALPPPPPTLQEAFRARRAAKEAAATAAGGQLAGGTAAAATAAVAAERPGAEGASATAPCSLVSGSVGAAAAAPAPAESPATTPQRPMESSEAVGSGEKADGSCPGSGRAGISANGGGSRRCGARVSEERSSSGALGLPSAPHAVPAEASNGAESSVPVGAGGGSACALGLGATMPLRTAEAAQSQPFAAVSVRSGPS